jgi:hypothetical protein
LAICDDVQVLQVTAAAAATTSTTSSLSHRAIFPVGVAPSFSRRDRFVQINVVAMTLTQGLIRAYQHRDHRSTSGTGAGASAGGGIVVIISIIIVIVTSTTTAATNATTIPTATTTLLPKHYGCYNYYYDCYYYGCY